MQSFGHQKKVQYFVGKFPTWILCQSECCPPSLTPHVHQCLLSNVSMSTALSMQTDTDMNTSLVMSLGALPEIKASAPVGELLLISSEVIVAVLAWNAAKTIEEKMRKQG